MLLRRAPVLHNLDLRAGHGHFDPGFDFIERFHHEEAVIPGRRGIPRYCLKVSPRASSTPRRSARNDKPKIISRLPVAETHRDLPTVPSRASQISARGTRLVGLA